MGDSEGAWMGAPSDCGLGVGFVPPSVPCRECVGTSSVAWAVGGSSKAPFSISHVSPFSLSLLQLISAPPGPAAPSALVESRGAWVVVSMSHGWGPQ